MVVILDITKILKKEKILSIFQLKHFYCLIYQKAILKALSVHKKRKIIC